MSVSMDVCICMHTSATRGRHRMRRLDGITDSMDVSWSKLRQTVRTGRPGVLQSVGRKAPDMT